MPRPNEARLETGALKARAMAVMDLSNKLVQSHIALVCQHKNRHLPHGSNDYAA
jgi:hypothetical protein